MKRIDIYAVAFLFGLLGLPCVAADSYSLAPGERIIAIDGKPVQGLACQNGQCRIAPKSAGPIAAMVNRHVVRKNERAYQWALQEAKLCAANGYRNGHPRGSGGWSRVGTGYSHSSNSPVHCLSEYHPSRYLARAVYHCPRTGRYYWCVVM